MMARKTFPEPVADTTAPGATALTSTPPLAPVTRQRRRGVVAVGVLLVAGGGLLAYQTVTQLNERAPIVVASRDIPVGQRISSSDVAIVRVGADGGMATVPGRQLSRVVGSLAAVDLRRGTAIPPTALTDQASPSSGQQLVPVAVKPSRLPARGLLPGDLVLIVPAPEGTAGGAQDSKATTPGQINATVDRVTGTPDTDGLVVVDLLVSAADGPTLARQAADGQITFVLTARRP